MCSSLSKVTSITMHGSGEKSEGLAQLYGGEFLTHEEVGARQKKFQP